MLPAYDAEKDDDDPTLDRGVSDQLDGDEDEDDDCGEEGYDDVDMDDDGGHHASAGSHHMLSPAGSGSGAGDAGEEYAAVLALMFRQA